MAVAKKAKAKAPAKKKTPAKKVKAEAPAKAAKAAKPAKAKTAAPEVESAPAPEVGAEAPTFSLAADDGSTVDLAGLRGKNVVLYFYPKDSTPGCTIEACGFRDHHDALSAAGAVVLGVSRDSIASHAKFKEKQSLPFRLLSDPDAQVIGRYGSWGEKSFMGRKFMGIRRTTVLIGKDGLVKKVYPNVSPKTHAQEILADLKSLG